RTPALSLPEPAPVPPAPRPPAARPFAFAAPPPAPVASAPAPVVEWVAHPASIRASPPASRSRFGSMRRVMVIPPVLDAGVGRHRPVRLLCNLRARPGLNRNALKIRTRADPEGGAWGRRRPWRCLDCHGARRGLSPWGARLTVLRAPDRLRPGNPG